MEDDDRLLRAHLELNPKSWDALRLRGVDDGTMLQLDFEFTAPGEEQTRALMASLRAVTDYEFKGGARNEKDGSQRWLVLGTTSPMALSLERLNEWVTWMIAHGREHGPAEFDGWGARTPESAPPAPVSAKGLLRRLGRGR